MNWFLCWCRAMLAQETRWIRATVYKTCSSCSFLSRREERERSQHACLWNKKVYKQRRQQVKSSETRFTSLYRRRCRWLDFCSTSSNRAWCFACQILNGVETTPIRLKAAPCFGFWTPVKMCSKVQKKFTVCLHFLFFSPSFQINVTNLRVCLKLPTSQRLMCALLLFLPTGMMT